MAFGFEDATALNGLTLVNRNPDKAVDLRADSKFSGWLFFRHPDGHWVTERKLESWEIMQAEDQRDEGIVVEG